MTPNEIHTQDPFAFLTPHQFILLTTYRKNGTPMPTTVWFASDGGKIYITTNRNAGKTKRIRNNKLVEMTPSDRVGNLLGEPTVKGHAHEVSAEERQHARSVLEQKYGELFERIAGPDTPDRTYILVEPAVNE